MPLREQANFLRQPAIRLRNIVALDPSSPLSPRLIEMATDLDKQACDLEERQMTADLSAASRPRS
jgi:hypothetical protein